MTNDTGIRIRADYVYAASLFRDGDSGSSYCGIHITPLETGGVAIMSLNGQHGCILRDENGHTQFPMTLRVTNPLLAMCKKRRIKGMGTLYVTIRDYRVAVVSACGGEEYIQPGDAMLRYPFPAEAFAKNFAKEWSPCAVHESVSSKAMLMNAMRYLGIQSFASYTSGIKSPVMYRGINNDDFAAVIAPMVQLDPTDPNDDGIPTPQASPVISWLP